MRRRLALAEGAAALALVLALAACATSPPPVRVENDAATVRAPTAELAARTARLVAEMEPRISALLPDVLRSPFEVWVEGELNPPDRRSSHGIAAWTVTTTQTDTGDRRSVIHVPAASATDRAVLAHEIAHARLGPGWRRLPDFVVEGVCEYVASRLSEEFPRREGRRHLALAALASRVPLTVECSPGAGAEATVALTPGLSQTVGFGELCRRDLGRSGQARDWEEERVAYAFGYLVTAAIADRAGLEQLRDLCRRAEEAGLGRVPPEWIADAAGIPTDGSLPGWVCDRMDGPSLEEVASLVAPAIAGILLSDFRASRLAPDPGSFLARFSPRLRTGSAEIPLAPVPDLRRALRRDW